MKAQLFEAKAQLLRKRKTIQFWKVLPFLAGTCILSVEKLINSYNLTEIHTEYLTVAEKT
jgi:hypothetical protein